MFKESLLDKVLYSIKKLIPKSIFHFFQPAYHTFLAHAGAAYYGYPSRSMKVIGVTGTKGKSTTVFMISRLLEETGHKKMAAIGSLGFKILDKEWPNNLKMTMPGRFRIHKFMAEAKKAGCEFLVLEVTSEGIKQKRHLGIQFDCAVFTNLHKEHLESHGSFENYMAAKQELFKRTHNIHVLNADDIHVEQFANFPSKKKIFYGLTRGDMVAQKVELNDPPAGGGSAFELYGTEFKTNLAGKFNILNCLAALSVGAMYDIDLPSAKPVIEKISNIPGRMEYVQRKPFSIVVDYAHTPDSLKAVYQTLRDQLGGSTSKSQEEVEPLGSRLICVLGACGGGRDKWKRPEFGRIASEFCDEIILTNEDPYDESPDSILNQIESGFSNPPVGGQISSANRRIKSQKIMDRKEAIKKAISDARDGDIVVITGKGSEISMAVAGGKKIPWSDRSIVLELIKDAR